MSINFKPISKGSGVAYLFPGQGAQSVGMGRELYDQSSAARSVFNEVDTALERPLSSLLFDGPEDDLRQTLNAQPAIMAVSLAAFNAMEENLGVELMPKPELIAGHSLGEYTALAVAGVLTIGETANLVQQRARLMQAACEQNPGSMAAVVGLDQITIEEICREAGTYVSNINTPNQIVISGDMMAVANTLDMALARGARKAIPLRVGGAFHSALMEPAKLGLAEVIREMTFKDPTVPIVANCTGEPLTKAQDVKRELISQICKCVEWERSIDYMIGSGVSQFFEVGPGSVLSAMVKRIDSSAEAVSVGDMDAILRLNRN